MIYLRILFDSTLLNKIARNLLEIECIKEGRTTGLLFKIIKIFSKFKTNQKYVLWICTFFEAYLRGRKNIAAHAIGLSGVIYFIVEVGFYINRKVLINDKIEKVNIRQIFFDLLGEVIKFSNFNFTLFLKILADEKWEKAFGSLCESNLLDSNVLVRSVVLQTKFTMEKLNKISDSPQLSIFGKESKTTISNYLKQNPRWKSYFSNSILKMLRDRTFWLLQTLVDNVIKAELSSDSMAPTYIDICCLNTFLIILLVQRSENFSQFEGYIGDLKKWLSSNELNKGFNSIINKWEFYYITKTREIFRLEYATNVKYNRLISLKSEIMEKYGLGAE